VTDFSKFNDHKRHLLQMQTTHISRPIGLEAIMSVTASTVFLGDKFDLHIYI